MKLAKLFLYSVMVVSLPACTESINTELVSDATTEKESAHTEAAKYIAVSRKDYQEKLHGFWLGQSIANWTGLVTEMDKVGTPATMPFYTDEDWAVRIYPQCGGKGYLIVIP